MGSIRDKIIADQTRLSAEKPWAAAATKDFTKFDTGAQKEVEGKLRMDLIPPEVEKAYAEVLTFGSGKYTRVETLTYNKVIQLCQESTFVDAILTYTVGECVEIATTDNLKPIIQSMQRGNGKIVGTGEIGTQRNSKSIKRLECLARKLEKEMREPNFCLDLGNLDLPRINIENCAIRDVKYAEQKNIYISIIATTQGNLEEFYVVSATTALECLEIILKVLKKHCGISGIAPLTEGQLKVSGDRNWQKGIPYMSCVAALKRHLNSWLLKEDINEESGFNHVKHVLFWAAALTYFVENANLELDDR